VSFFQDELLPDDFSPIEEEIDLLFNPQYIKKVSFLGDSQSLGLKVYHITHDSPHDPRVSLTKDTFRLMKEFNDFHVLAFYTSPGSMNYRLSYVTIGITADDKKVKYEYSNPRRYSYFLGPDAKIHTPARFLIKKGRIVDINDLQERFSVEVVNKEFYRRIATLFTSLVGGKRKEGSKTSDYKAILKLPFITDHQKMQEFAVRMIGRIVFCWFLKKKAAPNGDSLIPESVLSLTSVKENKNYYHTVLEKLFFKVLNTPIKDRREEFKTGPFAQIPFLNGGLFEPHNDDFYKPDELFGTSQSHNLIVPDNWLEELFELLEEYNFTIDENTSMDVELSVDPEMLGRIFENLLAEINPETGETARKSTGSYYTPRPIVEYMVDESLKQYLLTKTGIKEEKLEELLSYSEDVKDLTDDEKDKIINALDEVKIIDPACGSGAFPMGILQKMVLILQKADPESMDWLIKQLDRIPDVYVRNIVEEQLMKENWNYIRKLGLIQNSIYGVDIQQIAVEISKLRVFLSLIVDSKIDDAEENRGIKPLPNLEFKFVCANTLIGLPEGLEKNERGTLFEAGAEIKKLKSLRESYFSSFGHRKHQIEKQFREIQDKMFNHSLEMVSMGDKTLALSDWDPFSDKAADWFDPEWMFDVKDGFDIVIANPPYVRQEAIKDIKPLLKKDFGDFYCGTADLYTYFYKCGLGVLKQGGHLCFIAPNKFMRAGYGKNTRRLLSRDATPRIVIDFGNLPIFEATTYPSIILLENRAPKADEKAIAATFKDDYQLHNIVGNIMQVGFPILITALNTDGWILEPPEILKLMKKLRNIGTPLGEYIHRRLYRGVLTGYNDAFVIDGETREKLISEDPRSAELIKPWLRGRDIRKWRSQWAGFYIIAVPSSLNREWPWSNENKEENARRIFSKSYPAVHRHISQWEKKLRKRDDQGKFWWELRSCVYYEEFEKSKIIYPEISTRGQFIIDENSLFCDTTAYILLDSSRYLLGLLNSKLITFIFSKVSSEIRGGFFRWKRQYMEQIPIMVLNLEKPDEKRMYDQIVLKVDVILELMHSDDYSFNTDEKDSVKTYEREIDQMVYKLYELTPEEIAIVEGELKK
jgi:hypothetical protein